MYMGVRSAMMAALESGKFFNALCKNSPVKRIKMLGVLCRYTFMYHSTKERIVWMGFEAWGEAAVKNAPDEGVKRLKKKLAMEIVDRRPSGGRYP